METLIIKTQEDIDKYRKSGGICSIDLRQWEGLDINLSNITIHSLYMQESTFKHVVFQNNCIFEGSVNQYNCIFECDVYQSDSVFKGDVHQSDSTFEDLYQQNCIFECSLNQSHSSFQCIYQDCSTFKSILNQDNSTFYLISQDNCKKDVLNSKMKNKKDINNKIDLKLENELTDTPSYYDNTKGSIFKLGIERSWNGYVIDIVKRLERAEDKGEFLSDIDKAINTLKLYKNEQGHRFNGETEILNKKI